MIDKYIEILNRQIAKLQDEDFDLEAWKSATKVLLGRIFGDATTKIDEIEKIKFDFGSWSLRDATGSRDQMESCKKRGRGVLDACLIELEILGIEEENTKEIDDNSALKSAIEQELKKSEYDRLIKFLKSKSSREDKRKMLIPEIQKLDTLVAPAIVANILTDPTFKKVFE